MLSYHQIIKWHEQYDPAMHISETEQDEPSAEATYNKNYIQQKLEHGLNRIWKVCFSNEFGIVVCMSPLPGTSFINNLSIKNYLPKWS